MLVATLGGPTMFARIGVINRHVERMFNPDRKDPALGASEVGKGSMTRVE
jgi:hypothetical protein